MANWFNNISVLKSRFPGFLTKVNSHLVIVCRRKKGSTGRQLGTARLEVVCVATPKPDIEQREPQAVVKEGSTGKMRPVTKIGKTSRDETGVPHPN